MGVFGTLCPNRQKPWVLSGLLVSWPVCWWGFQGVSFWGTAQHPIMQTYGKGNTPGPGYLGVCTVHWHLGLEWAQPAGPHTQGIGAGGVLEVSAALGGVGCGDRWVGV